MHELTIIDDDRQFSVAFAAYLKKQITTSIRVRTLVGASTALQFLRSHYPDIVIISAEFENANGFDLIRESKKLNNPAKFIVMSEKDGHDIFRQALLLGVSDFFVKPTDFASLSESVNRLLQDIEKENENVPHSEYDVIPKSDRMFSDLLAGRIKNPVELSLRLSDANLKSNYINRPCALINVHINSFSSWLTTCWDSGAERFYKEIKKVLCGATDKAEFILSRTFYSNIELLCINNSQIATEVLLEEYISLFSKKIMDTFGIYSEIHTIKIFTSLSEIMKYNLQEPVNTDNKSEKIIENAIKYLRHNYFREITLEDVSNYVNLSKGYFCTYYRKNAGENFLDTLTRHRVEMSKRLLTNTTLTINQIAENVGYRSSSYFHKAFKSLCGVSPSEFRKKNK